MKRFIYFMIINLTFFTSLAQDEQTILNSLIDLEKNLEIPVATTFPTIQQNFLQFGRKYNEERWQLPEIILPLEQEKKVYKNIIDLGLVYSVEASKKNYDYAVVLGGNAKTMYLRIEYLAKMWQKGVRWKETILLTGQRVFSDQIDKDLCTLISCKEHPPLDKANPVAMHETEIAYLLIQYMALPKEMTQVKIRFIDSPRKLIDNEWLRPNTRDTIKQWKKDVQLPNKANALFVSNQPFVNYQHTIAVDEFHHWDWNIETIGSEVQDTIPIKIYLDAISTWLNYYLPTHQDNQAIYHQHSEYTQKHNK